LVEHYPDAVERLSAIDFQKLNFHFPTLQHVEINIPQNTKPCKGEIKHIIVIKVLRPCRALSLLFLISMGVAHR